MDPARLTATEAAKHIAAGDLSAVAWTKACLARIAERESEVGAWIHLDAGYALLQAQQADERRARGVAPGPLHGIPVGIKDVIDTTDMPTEHGSPLFRGRRPTEDAAVVAALRKAGAIILGKTVTTELAVFHPGKTRNPRNLGHTPGGSSSGSAAAVADFMAPLALGTQTAGSVIRPASYCGVFGFKPSFGAISRAGVLPQAAELDTVGMFARSLDDLRLLVSCLMPEAERATDAPATFAFVKTPSWADAEPVLRDAFEHFTAALGLACEEVALPDSFAHGTAWQRMLQVHGIARNFGPLLDREPNKVSEVLCGMIAEGRALSDAAVAEARAMQSALYAEIAPLLARCAAILTPATTGPAPHGLEKTGSPAFAAVWTYLGMPAVALPLLESDGLPIGVQLVGARGADLSLLRTANRLSRQGFAVEH